MKIKSRTRTTKEMWSNIVHKLTKDGLIVKTNKTGQPITLIRFKNEDSSKSKI